MNETRAARFDGRATLIILLALGSLWGLSEVALGDGIRAAGIPFRAAILVGVGIFLAGAGLALLRRPLALLLLPVLAVGVKMLIVPVLRLSPLCIANSCVAVGLEGAVLAGVALAARRGIERGRAARVAAGAGAGLAGAVLFWLVGMRVAPCPYLLTFAGGARLPAWLGAEALPWAVTAAAGLALGWALGERLRAPLLAAGAKRPVLTWSAGGAVAAASWLLAAWNLAA
ncbi:MAG: hypothetical protein JW819_09670 [Candidatus Krumholzibacteriota bacterium]|nr:hypothetical protein [Candidatus Krumholzibacteriota bacterium]